MTKDASKYVSRVSHTATWCAAAAAWLRAWRPCAPCAAPRSRQPGRRCRLLLHAIGVRLCRRRLGLPVPAGIVAVGTSTASHASQTATCTCVSWPSGNVCAHALHMFWRCVALLQPAALVPRLDRVLGMAALQRHSCCANTVSMRCGGARARAARRGNRSRKHVIQSLVCCIHHTQTTPSHARRQKAGVFTIIM